MSQVEIPERMSRKMIIYILLTLLLIVALSTGLVYRDSILRWICSPFEKAAVKSFAQQLFDAQVPEKTVVLARSANKSYAISGADYYAMILVNSDLAIDDIKTRYSTISFRPHKPTEHVQVEIEQYDKEQAHEWIADIQMVSKELAVAEVYPANAEELKYFYKISLYSVVKEGDVEDFE